MSDETRMTDFDLFIHDIRNGDNGEPRTLEQIVRDTPKELTAKDILEQHKRDIDRPRSERDPHGADQAVAQLRIAQELRQPSEVKKSATTEPDFSNETTHDALMVQLGLEVGDPELPRVDASAGSLRVPVGQPAGLPDHGRVGQDFAKAGGGPQRSFLDGSVSEIFTKVAGRLTGGAREFAEQAAQQAESEGL